MAVVNNPIAQRVSSVDAYRGLVMVLMMAEVLEFSHVAEAIPDSSFWAFLAYQQSHVSWVGCSLHDLIQPSFTFLVGVALPYSIASRSTRAQSHTSLWLHTLRRALILILLGIFLRSMYRDQTNFTFEDTLTQIGLGYPLLFALGFRSERVSWIALGVLLVGYWAVFALYPLPGPNFRLVADGRQSRLGTPPHRLRRALEQKYQRRLGLRPLVSESVPAREAVSIQWRRVRYPQFYPYPGYHDSGLAGRALAEKQSVRHRTGAALSAYRHWAVCHCPIPAFHRYRPHRQAHLDAFVDAVQRWLVLCIAGGFLLSGGYAGSEKTFFSSHCCRYELHCGLYPGPYGSRFHRQLFPH